MAMPIPREQPQPKQKIGSKAKMVNINQWNSPLNIPAVNRFLGTLGIPTGILQSGRTQENPQPSPQDIFNTVGGMLGLVSGAVPLSAVVPYLGRIAQNVAASPLVSSPVLGVPDFAKGAFAGFMPNTKLDIQVPQTTSIAPPADQTATTAPKIDMDKIDRLVNKLNVDFMAIKNPQKALQKKLQTIEIWRQNGRVTDAEAEQIKQILQLQTDMEEENQNQGLFDEKTKKLIGLMLLIKLLSG